MKVYVVIEEELGYVGIDYVTVRGVFLIEDKAHKTVEKLRASCEYPACFNFFYEEHTAE